jgi:predicted dehydrogenase
MIQVGAGGWGSYWCKYFLPEAMKDGLVEVVALVDIDEEAVSRSREPLGLRQDQCYTDLAQAFDENKADFSTVVVPPAQHESIVDMALKHDMHILSEKPIADTMEAAVRIANKVKSADKKMGVTMSHRYDQDKTSFREQVKTESNGELDYLVLRFGWEKRKYGSVGKSHHHKMEDFLMIECAVHHLDLLASFADSKCDTLYAQTWTPRWGEYGGDAQGLVSMSFENGVKATYEGSCTNAVEINGWGSEYIRAECENATIVLNDRNLERFGYDPEGGSKSEGQGQKIDLLKHPKWTHAWLIEEFVHWLGGGPPMETNVHDNLQSAALVFSAIQSSRTGQPVNVQEFLSGHLN